MTNEVQSNLTLRLSEDIKRKFKNAKPRGMSWNLFIKELLDLLKPKG